MASEPIQLTESISVTSVTESGQAPLALDIEFSVRVTDTDTRRCTFTVSEKIPGTPPTVPLLSEGAVINEAHKLLRGKLQEAAKETEDKELGKRFEELAEE